ncbi:hypothetical protein EPUL_001146, partial [Erysiphe pulchra]
MLAGNRRGETGDPCGILYTSLIGVVISPWTGTYTLIFKAASWLDLTPMIRELIDNREKATEQNVAEFNEQLIAHFPAKLVTYIEGNLQNDTKNFAQKESETLTTYYQRALHLLRRSHGRDSLMKAAADNSLVPIEQSILNSIISVFLDGIFDEEVRGEVFSIAALSCGSLWRCREIIGEVQQGLDATMEARERAAERNEVAQIRAMCAAHYGKSISSVLAEFSSGKLMASKAKQDHSNEVLDKNYHGNVPDRDLDNSQNKYAHRNTSKNGSINGSAKYRPGNSDRRNLKTLECNDKDRNRPIKQARKVKKALKYLREIVGREGCGPINYIDLAKRISIPKNLLELWQVSPDAAKEFRRLSIRVNKKRGKRSPTELFSNSVNNDYTRSLLNDQSTSFEKNAFRVPVVAKAEANGKIMKVTLPKHISQADQVSDISLISNLLANTFSLKSPGVRGFMMQTADKNLSTLRTFVIFMFRVAGIWCTVHAYIRPKPKSGEDT